MQINSDFEVMIKLVIIGDSSVGKTNFIFQFTEGRFSTFHVATVGFDYKTRIIKLPSSKKKVKLQIWDTAGQERYMALNKNLFQKVQGIILMYDLTNRDSFENLNSWLNLVTQNVSNKIIMLVGNKLDLADEKRIVTETEGRMLAQDNKILFSEASGSSGENVDKVFIEISEKIYSSIMEEKNDKNDNIVISNNEKNGKKRCC